MMQEETLVRDVMLRMRADEACIHKMNAVLSDYNPGNPNPFFFVQRKVK